MIPFFICLVGKRTISHPRRKTESTGEKTARGGRAKREDWRKRKEGKTTPLGRRTGRMHYRSASE